MGVTAGMERAEVPKEEMDRLRDAVAAVRKKHPWVSLRGELEAALLDRVRQLETYYNDSKPFPQRKGPLRGGRPKKPPRHTYRKRAPEEDEEGAA